jgi:predicted TPR repeat methyltransferase
MKRKKPKRSLDELIDVARQHADRDELAQAEALYREAIALAPDHPATLTLLGLLLVDRANIDGAIDLLERAREFAPQAPPVHLALGSAYAAGGHDAQAVTALETAIKLDTTSTVPLERLAKHHIVVRRSREALGVLRRILGREPGNAHARFVLAGLTGERGDARADAQRDVRVERGPAALIADLFETYAAKFDEHLVDKLQYAVPTALAALVAQTGASPDGSWRVLDVGCGTGLAGVAIRPYARTQIGSDLSPRMIARARQRGIYDELHVEDLVTTADRAREVDLIVAADVFIYVGVLEATFAACATALRPGGLLAFSVERSDSGPVILQSTLRYAHSDAYIRGLASTHELALERAEPATLRVDNGVDVVGVLYLLRRRSA